MLPELILREEHQENYPLLLVLGLSSVTAGYIISRALFPGRVGLMTVMFGAIPLVFPLTSFFLEDEKEGRPHLPEIKVYGSLFAGEVVGFTALGLATPDLFQAQTNVFSGQLVQMGLTGYATSSASFSGILLNNLVVFAAIIVVATLIGSAGAFILTWNASVLGVFLAVLAREIPNSLNAFLTGHGGVPTPFAYVPHAAFEMSGFIVAGITGSLASAALYREDLDRDTWEDLAKLAALGAGLIVAGAAIESF